MVPRCCGSGTATTSGYGRTVTQQIRQLALLAVVAVVVSVTLIVYGFPESNPSQSTALELGALPLAVALAACDLIVLARAQRRPGSAIRWALRTGWVLAGVGIAVTAAAYLTGPRMLSQLGQFVSFVGLLGVLLIAVSLQGPARVESFRLDEVVDTTDDEPQAPAGQADASL